MRAALYVRVSTDRQQHAQTIEQQVTQLPGDGGRSLRGRYYLARRPRGHRVPASTGSTRPVAATAGRRRRQPRAAD